MSSCAVILSPHSSHLVSMCHMCSCAETANVEQLCPHAVHTQPLHWCCPRCFSPRGVIKYTRQQQVFCFLDVSPQARANGCSMNQPLSVLRQQRWSLRPLESLVSKLGAGALPSITRRQRAATVTPPGLDRCCHTEPWSQHPDLSHHILPHRRSLRKPAPSGRKQQHPTAAAHSTR